MTKQALSSYLIDPWQFFPREHRLVCDEEDIVLTPLQSGIIEQLIIAHPQVVSANQLLESLEEHAEGNRNKLYQSIAKLRRVFNDTSHKANFIETVARKGYRLVPTPQERCIDEFVEEDVEQSNDVDIHSGALEQNIFDDLGFIDQSEQQTTHTPVESLAKPLSEQSTEINTLQQIQDKTARFSRVSLVVMALIVIIVGYFLLANNDEIVSNQAPEQLFVMPLVVQDLTETNEQLSANVQWWINQKLQHLPLVKIRQTVTRDNYPLLVATLGQSSDEQAVISIEYWRDDQQAPQTLKLALASSEKSSYATFNQQIVNAILNSKQVGLTDDVCTLGDFAEPLASTNDSCLLVLYRQGQALLQQPMPAPANELLDLSTQITNKFPNASLGYDLMARYHNRQGLVGQAIDDGMRSMELNPNNAQSILFLSALYRLQSDHHHSMQLTELLVSLAPNNATYRYWQSFDLMALGYRQRANELLKQHDISLTSIADELHFTPLNYNKMKSWLASNPTISASDSALIIDKLRNSSFADLTPVNRFKKALTKRAVPKIQRVDSSWRSAGKSLFNGDVEQGIDAIEDDPSTGDFVGTFSLDTDDRVFYIPTYANLLLQSGNKKAADSILKRFILLAQANKHDTQWTLTLAQAYALTGDSTKALAELAKLLATGWLPHPERQLWTLGNNPNLSSLSQQWEFINLLELIENRRKLMLVLIKEKADATVK